MQRIRSGNSRTSVRVNRGPLLRHGSRLVQGRPTSTSVACAALAGIAVLHVAWGLGASWPFADRSSFADAVGGTTEEPSFRVCLAVAGALGVAAALIGGRPQRAPALRRLGAAGVVAVLIIRGALGVLGRTDLLAPDATSERFRHLDQCCYAPLCLILAALSVPAIIRARAACHPMHNTWYRSSVWRGRTRS